jgi:hypothetical protein
MYQLFLFWYDIITNGQKKDSSVFAAVSTELAARNKAQLLLLRDSLQTMYDALERELEMRGDE